MNEARVKKVGLSDKLLLWGLRSGVLVVLAVTAFGLYGSLANGDVKTLYLAGDLLWIGSVLAYLAKLFADISGSYSRFQLQNVMVHYYSSIFVPSLLLIALWLLSTHEFRQAGSTLIVAGIFALMGYAGRQCKLNRLEEAHN